MSTDFTSMGRDKSQSKYLYQFIHNVYAEFFSDMLDYFEWSYPRFEYTTIGTYQKSVEYITKKIELEGRESDMPNKSCLILNPTGEFNIADGNAGGKQLWRFPNLAPGLAIKLFNPIYQDGNVEIIPGFQRIKGEIELIMLVESFYEYCDLRMFFLNLFGGTERIIEPQFFTSFIVLPEELVNYRYINEYTGKNYVLDWEAAGAFQHVVKTTARNELVISVSVKPQLSLASIADASTRYGGTDKLPDWRLTATVNYEIELPSWIILKSDYLAQGMKFTLSYGSTYSAYNDFQPPEGNILFEKSWDWGLGDTPGEILSDATSVIQTTTSDYEFNTRYFHTVTQSDIDSTSSYLDITLPETILQPKILIVNSKYGELNYGDHFLIVDNGTILRVKRDNVTLEVGMILELFVYKEVI